MFKSIIKRTAAFLMAGMMAVTMYAVPVHAEGTYASELTGLPISAELVNKRPVAVMIDNDARALPHYGLASADIVYELVNSTANGRITRLMAVYKDIDSVGMIGNIRSTRPTNILLASEYNAVLVHDGGPFYNNPYFTSTAIAHLSGGFTRVKNGKASEFTEFCAQGEATRRMASAGIPSTYTVYPGSHFRFGVNDMAAGIPITYIALPFQNTKSALSYNAATATYDFYEFGKIAVDGGTNQVVTFKNVIIQNTDIHQYDKNGYLIYNCIGFNAGYFLSNGKCYPITWAKANETGITHYYDAAGQEIILNPGKTYITLVPSDTWGNIAFGS